MNRALAVLALAALAIGVSGCKSTTVIRSNPSGARLFLDGADVGQTPYTLTDTKTFLQDTQVKLELKGHEPLTTSIKRNEEVDIVPLIFTVFWGFKYHPEHVFELKPRRHANASARNEVAAAP